MGLQGQGEDSGNRQTGRLSDSAPPYSLSSPAASLSQLCEQRQALNSWPLKAPGGPFSSSLQLLPIHLAHFLKAHSPGPGTWGFWAPAGTELGSQPHGGGRGLQSRGTESPAAFRGHACEVSGKDMKASLWRAQRILPLVICILETFWLSWDQMGRLYLPF